MGEYRDSWRHGGDAPAGEYTLLTTGFDKVSNGTSGAGSVSICDPHDSDYIYGHPGVRIIHVQGGGARSSL
jgi:hypothetical protein